MTILRTRAVTMVFLALCMASPHSFIAQEPWKNARIFDAVLAGKTEVVAAALSAGTDPNTRRPGFGSLLVLATTNGRLDIVNLLLSRGADPRAVGNESLLVAAINTGRMEIVTRLVEAGARITKPKDACFVGEDILAAAVEKDNIQMVEFLLAHGADPKGTSAFGDQTSFQVAAILGRVEMMKLLLNAGADINHRDWNGMSALMLACQKGQQAAVEFLLSHGADPSFQDGYDRTASSLASQLKGENAQKLQVLCAGKK